MDEGQSTASKRAVRAFANIWIATIFLSQFALPLRAAHAAELRVAAASDLTFVFKDIVASYQKESGNTLKVSFGSSGNFFALIKNGAPYDVLFSADIAYPKQLEAAGLTVPTTLYTYAQGTLVIWVPSASKLDLSGRLDVLLDP